MAVHMFRVYVGRGPMSVADLETRVDDWINSNAEWEDDTAAHGLSERNTRLDGTGATYYGADVRFLLDDAKDNLLQKFTDKLVNKVDWYRVGYHECSHDESDPTGCDWQDSEEWAAQGASIPAAVPDFEVV